jgi:imidazolonepropionase-like amidohydrolase
MTLPILRSAFALALVLVLALLPACAGDAKLDGDILITASRLFDGHEMQEPGALLIRGGEIVAVGTRLDANATRKIEFGDATILPGFIDLHVHQEAGMLEGGVTTVRNLGTVIEAVRPPRFSGSVRLLTAGPIVTVPNGYPVNVRDPRIGLPVSSVEAARKAVGQLAGRGAAVIKISLDPGDGTWPMLTTEQVRAIVAEAHKNDLQVTAHAFRPEGVTRALAGGVDELAHAPCGATDGMLRELVDRDIQVVATLHVEQRMGGCAYVASRFVEFGGTLLYGSDVGNPGIPVGIDVVELRLMEQAGLTREDVLRAATSRAGEQIGLSPLGTLTEGAPADVIGVRGDARDFRTDLAAPLLVISRGRVAVEAHR